MTIALEALLHQLPYAGPWQIEAIRGGVVNSSWKVSNATQSFFVKQQRADDTNAIDRADEIILQRQLHELQLCPQVKYVSDGNEWVLFDWVDAPSLAESSLEEPERMRILAHTLARIHHSAPQVAPWSLYERIMHYCTNLAEQAPQKARAYKSQLEHFSRLIESWDKEAGCLCHNDLSLGHVLLSDPVKVVDWEYAGYGHPYFDIASCIEINDLDRQQVQWLCRFYSQQCDVEITPGEIATWRALVSVLNDLWYAVQGDAYPVPSSCRT